MRERFERKENPQRSYSEGKPGSTQNRPDPAPSRPEWGRDFGNELKNLSSIGYERIVEIARQVGEHLSPKYVGLKINQIRKFLDETRQIEAELKTNQFSADRVILLRPKLAYAAGRNPDVKDLMNVLDPAILSAAQSEENFLKLLRLIESIIAYHTYFGGKN